MASTGVRSFLDRRLFLAASGGHAEEVRALYRLGAECDYQDPETGNTALHACAEKGYIDAVVAVLASYCSTSVVEARNNSGLTPLHSAIERGNVAVIKTIIQHLGIRSMHITDMHGNTALHSAMHHGRFDLVQELLREGCDPNAANQRGNTALHIAASRGEEEGLEELLFAGAQIDARNGIGQTPLHLAAEEGHTTLCRCLAHHGANVDAVDMRGLTPIRSAIHGTSHFSRTRVIEQLLKCGANPGIPQPNGATALHDAATRDQQAVVKQLMKGGAIVNCVTIAGLTPLHMAAREGRGESRRRAARWWS
jgi:ankyrin repeat protein